MYITESLLYTYAEIKYQYIYDVISEYSFMILSEVDKIICLVTS